MHARYYAPLSVVGVKAGQLLFGVVISAERQSLQLFIDSHRSVVGVVALSICLLNCPYQFNIHAGHVVLVNLHNLGRHLRIAVVSKHLNLFRVYLYSHMALA